MKRSVSIVAALATSVGVLVGIAPPAAAADCAPQTATPAQIVTAQSSCDVTGWTVAVGGLTMVVPAPETMVNASVVPADFGDVAVYQDAAGDLAAAIDGTVAFSTSAKAADELAGLLVPGEGSTSGAVAARAEPDKCSPSSPYNLGQRWSAKRYGWYYNSSGQPSTSALTAIQRASQNLDFGRSTYCGPLSNGLVMAYAGGTTATAGLTATGCGVPDQRNVVQFGPLNTLVGLTCSWSTLAGYKSEADVRLDNSSRSWWYTTDMIGCSGARYDLEAVAIHEFGHAVGIEHVQDSTQVMKKTSYACDAYARHLGRGDQNGLRALYGS